MKSFVHIAPHYADVLRRNGLCSAADFLRVQAPIVSGHPDRHVLLVELHADTGARNDSGVKLVAYLKKEHCVGWRARWKNAWAGFGMVARSTREAVHLRAVERAGILCPEVMAWGEAEGQAFVMLRASAGRDLRLALAELNENERRGLAMRLGQELARLHDAGFDHPDLYSKHVLVEPGPRFRLLDWQRSRRRRTVSWQVRCRDLAHLDATLVHDLASTRVRLACLKSYLRQSRLTGVSRKEAARAIRRQSQRLQRQPRIREAGRAPLPAGTQHLIWLDGAALCVTRAFREELRGHVPHWLHAVSDAGVERVQVPLRGGRWAELVRRWWPGRGPWSKKTTPEQDHAVLLFRLERHDLPAPRLLAFGTRVRRLRGGSSFVLSEAPGPHTPLAEFLSHEQQVRPRLKLLEEAGRLWRRVHEAGYCVAKPQDLLDVFAVRTVECQARVILARVDLLRRTKLGWPELAARDLHASARLNALLRRTEMLRFLLGYLGQRRLRASSRISAAERLVLIRIAHLYERQVSA